MLRITYTALLILFSLIAITQEDSSSKKNWFISGGAGVQISGYKKVDFVSENVTPSFLLSTGIWLSPTVAIQANYKGFYFHTISDNDKHHYYYLFGEVKLDVLELLRDKSATMMKWQVLPHGGVGYFYNKYYDKPNFCGNIGASIGFKAFNKISIFSDVSAII